MPGPGPGATTRRRALAVWGLCVFVLALAWSLALVLATTPLGAFEEHFAIGQRLYRTGSLASEKDPGVLRPPGYPAFVAATLHARDAVAALRGLDAAQAGADEDAILLGQCLAVAAAAAAIFVFAASVLPAFEAACAGLVLACGPIAIALAGLRSYPALHLLGVAVASAQLASAARAPGGGRLAVLLSGVSWGIVTLIRPVSLILPAFVLLLARARRGGAWRPAAVFTLLFVLGMALPILPYAVRNHGITGRLVLVNVQGGFALWATTAGRPQEGQEFLSWPQLWDERGLRIYRQVTGEAEYHLDTFSTRVVELEDAFKRQALRNLKRQPSVYLRNVTDNLRSFCTGAMARWPESFADLNYRPAARARSLVGAYSLGLLLLALPGAALGLRRRDAAAWTVVLVFAALATAHAITFLNDRYTYVKLPLLAMGFAISLAAAADRSIALGGGRVRLRLASGIAAAALAGSAAATLLMLAP
jgi:hypothetical protein